MPTIYHLLPEEEMFSESHGGAISRWAANVLRAGPEIVVCPSYDDTWGFPERRVYRLPNWNRTHPVHPVLFRLPWVLQRAIYVRVFAPLLNRLNPGDIVYVHNSPESASSLATVAGKLSVTVVLHMHNSHLKRANRGQLAALKHWPIVFCSEFLRKEIRDVLPGHFTTTHLVYNGADESRFSAIERVHKSVPLIVFTGRVADYKGPHILAQAMRLLEERGVAARCQIVGRPYFANDRTTRYSRYLQRILPANTKMVGYRSGKEVAAVLQSADIHCCPSIWNDPFPLAPLEAMATGLPVVASRTGGLPETLAHGGGLLVPPDDVKALAGALEELVRDPDYRRALSKEASASARNYYRWSSVRSQYEAVIRSVATTVGSAFEFQGSPS
jgi:spore coat protein SA